MLGRLLPLNINFFDYFEKHAGIVLSGTQDFFSMVSTQEGLLEKSIKIKQAEHDADTVAHHCLEDLHKSFFTPFEREDIHQLISCMDDIIDDVEEAAEKIILYRLTDMTPEIKCQSRILVLTVQEMEMAVKKLSIMKSQVKDLRGHCLNINRFENEADVIFRESLARLFDEEMDVKALIKWKEIYEALERAIDRCEDVANIIEGLILEYN